LERLRFSLSVVEQTVMAWMETPWDRETCRYFDSDPVPKVHPKLSEICSEKNVPFRQVVKKKSAPWLYYSNALRDPGFAPLKIHFIRFLVIAAPSILLAQIKWGVSKNGIDNFVLYPRQDLQAIGGKEGA